jgi:hypothetical protein
MGRKHKYTAAVTLIFESEANLPDVNFRGTVAEVEKMVGTLPLPADASRNGFAALGIERVVPSSPDPY